jgi:hypothetical protein
MLTVKLSRQVRHGAQAPAPMEPGDVGRFSTRIIEAESVDVHYIRPGEVIEVAGGVGDRSFAFNIIRRGAERPEGFADEVDFWHEAFIENSAGATTEVVRL